MNTYGISERRAKARKQTEEEHIQATRHPYETLLERIRTWKEDDGWMPLFITKMNEEFGIGEKNYQSDVVYSLRCHPNIITKDRPAVSRGRIQSVTLYKWVSVKEKARLLFRSIVYQNIHEKEIQRLESFYPHGIGELNVNDILCVYDYLEKSGAGSKWIEFRPLTISSQRGVYMDHILQVLNDLQERKAILIQEVQKKKRLPFYIGHLVTEDHPYEDLLEEMMTGKAAYEFQPPTKKSRKKRASIIAAMASSQAERSIKAEGGKASTETQEKIIKDAPENPFLMNAAKTKDLFDTDQKSGTIDINHAKLQIGSLIDDIVRETYRKQDQKEKAMQTELAEAKQALESVTAKFHLAAKENYSLKSQLDDMQKAYRELKRKQENSDIFIRHLMQNTSEKLTDMQGQFLNILGSLSNMRRDQLCNPSILNRIKLDAFHVVEETSKAILNYTPDRLPPNEKR